MWFNKERSKHKHFAIIDVVGETTYDTLWSKAEQVAGVLCSRFPEPAARVGIYMHPSADFAAALLGIWQAGQIAVPLCMSHPAHELKYVLEDAGIDLIVSNRQTDLSLFGPMVAAVNWLLMEDEADGLTPVVAVNPSGPALIIYTSGTTSRPKGAILTHSNLQAQITSLSEAWRWSEEDVILNVLPLHHVHGLINILCCSLYNGACCVFHRRFDPVEVWNWFVTEQGGHVPTLFMAVPTIYAKLINAWEAASPAVQTNWSNAASKLRLMVSGSAALPESVLYRWEEISSHRLLERYGMTEIGMALSNPLSGIRKPGFVGKPLPGVSVQLRNENGVALAPDAEGELFVKGATVFAGYWNKPESSSLAFTEDGWFRTGDIAVIDAEGDYKILGRSSQDIIKSGGYKISALEIETALLNHPLVAECAVVGIADDEWGERVAAAVLMKNDSVTEEQLKEFLKKYLAPYKIPTCWMFIAALPRNAMGKVVKPELKKLFQG